VFNMPFIAICTKCNHLLFDSSKDLLSELIELHKEKSHDGNCSFVVFRITNAQYKALKTSIKSPAFWNAFNNSRKLNFNPIFWIG